jgi:hypothetical protein
VATSAGLASGAPGPWADGTAAFGVGVLLAQALQVRRTPSTAREVAA